MNDKDSYDTSAVKLFQIRGTNQFNTRAVQVAARGASLNSGDTFILTSPSKVWLWCGKGSTGDEREFAKSIARTIVPREYDIVSEGSEPAAFWETIVREPYAQVKTVDETITREARLFQCTNAVGS